jgi:hypothetical protein
MPSRPVPRTTIRKPKPTVTQLEEAFESVPDAVPAPPLEVVQERSSKSPEEVEDVPEKPRAKSKSKRKGAVASKKTEGRRKQTLYLSSAIHKKLRFRAIEDECELSDVAELALAAYLGA